MRIYYKSRKVRIINIVTLLAILVILIKIMLSRKIVRPVVIVGTGLAGLTTANQLVMHHAIPVILIDKAKKVGGNSIKASSGINGAQTKLQEELNINDTPDSFFLDTTRSAKGKGVSTLMKKLAFDSKGAIAWLSTSMGVQLDTLTRLGGHSFPRTHRSKGPLPPGFMIVSTLKKRLESLKSYDDSLVQFMMESKLLDVKINKNRKVYGIEYLDATGKTQLINTDHVVLATGGFGFSKNAIKKYSPNVVGLPTTNGPETTGDGQEILEKLGAQMIDMEQVQVHPTAFIDPEDRSSNKKFLAAEALRGEGGILIDRVTSKRFVNELATRDFVVESINKHCKDRTPLLIISEAAYERISHHMDFYISKQLIKRLQVKEVISEYNLNGTPEQLASTLIEYSNLTPDSDEFGRPVISNTFGSDVTPDTYIYVGEVTPAIHFTMGGARINTESQIVDNNNEPIAYGLYGAGEVTGGVHGSNRLGGSSLLECVVYGKQAADTIAKLLKNGNVTEEPILNDV